ncbi:MAG: hypothetical protein DMF56_11670 [Acidobacteria bacterium]|nr:MAG: hypothetical protein DMF56_11670 [Acidobacteriota bacterium]
MLKRWVVVVAAAAAPMLAHAQSALMLAGGVYEDRPSLALRTDLVLPLGGVTVKLYRDGGDHAPSADDVLVASTKTKADGLYVFRADRGDYWVAIDSRSIRAGAWPEQTFGPAGALCARPDGTTVTIQAEGPCFGGRTAGSDDATALATSEHVAGVKLDAPQSNVDFAFSFDAVTSAIDGENIQGSFRQFVVNANNVPGPNRMRFVPLLPAAQQRDPIMGVPQRWWMITFNTPLPELKDQDTLIDGVARNYLSPASATNVHPGRVGDSATIEPEDLAADRLQKPELELVVSGAEGIVCASRCAMRDFAVRGAASTVVLRADARLEHVLIGASPDALPAVQRSNVGMQIENGLTIAHLVLVTAQSNVGIAVGPNGRFQGDHLDVSRCGEPTSGGGLALLSNGSEIHSSVFNENRGAGIVIGQPDGSRPVSGNVIDGTTISGNQAGVVLSPGVTRNTVTRNDIMWNRLGGVTVTPFNDNSAPRENRLSANRYDENGLRPIILNLRSDPNILARASASCDHITTAANLGISPPVITSAQVDGDENSVNARVTIRGRACPGEVVELYQSFATSSVREKVAEMPRIRGVKTERETITTQERDVALPSIGEFNYIGSANTASDGTFEATFPFNIVKRTEASGEDVDRDTDIWAHDVLRAATPTERAFSAVAIDAAGNTSEMSVRRQVEKQVATNK